MSQQIGVSVWVSNYDSNGNPINTDVSVYDSSNNLLQTQTCIAATQTSAFFMLGIGTYWIKALDQQQLVTIDGSQAQIFLTIVANASPTPRPTPTPTPTPVTPTTMGAKMLEMGANFVLPDMAFYTANAGELLKKTNMNTIRYTGGNTGDAALNVLYSPNWLARTKALIQFAKTNGFKCYFQNLDDFGIDCYQMGYGGHQTSIDKANAAAVIDALAANGILTDPNLLFWGVANESDLSQQSVADSVLWLADYIRSKGGKVIAEGWNFQWNDYLSGLLPVIKNHVDAVGLHHYGWWELEGLNFDHLTATLNDYWQAQTTFAANGGFSNVYITEMGIQLGNSEMGLDYIDADNRRKYYQIYYNSLKNFPLFKGICNHGSISETLNAATEYGIINQDGSTIAGFDEVSGFYNGGTTVTTDTTTDTTPPPTSQCFIATAAGMTPTQLTQLRKIRDLIKTNPDGKTLVDFYYANAQKYIPLVEQKPELKKDIHDALELILKAGNNNPLLKVLL